MSISVSDDGKVTVRCPYGLSDLKIKNFVRSKSGWVAKHLEQINRRNDRFAEIREGKKILIGGQPFGFVIGRCNKVENCVVCVKNFSCLKSTVVGAFGEKFLLTFKELSSKFHLDFLSVGFRDYKARWGCCDARGNIIFNYKILMLPEHLQQYIIVHELCHTRVHNHSAEFKALLCSFMPDFRHREAQLKDFSFITRMY